MPEAQRQGHLLPCFFDSFKLPPAIFKKKGYRCTDAEAVGQMCRYKHENLTKISYRLKVNAVILVIVCTLNLGESRDHELD